MVYNQAKYWRPLFRKELMDQGFELSHIERVLEVGRAKFKKFIMDPKKVKIHKNLTNKRLIDVTNFYKRYEEDPRLTKLFIKKSRSKKRIPTSLLPEKSDMRIFAQAITLPDLYFVTTDGHFKVLDSELENEFAVNIMHDDNVLRRMREWNWI